MQGVEILTSAQFVTERAWNPLAFWITVVIVLGVFIGVAIVEACRDHEWIEGIVFVLIGLVASGSVGFVMGHVFSIPVDYENHYKAIISDEVSLTEFLECYEIIEQDGKLLTIREKNKEKN